MRKATQLWAAGLVTAMAHEDLSNKASKNTSKLDKAVGKMVDKYPPKGK